MRFILITLRVFFCIALSLLWLGNGHLVLGKRKSGLLFASSPFILCFAFTYSRSILSPKGLEIFLVFILILFLVSLAHLTTILINETCSIKSKNIVLCLGYSTVFLVAGSTMFIYQDKLFGIQIVEIESHSMSPTLHSRDIIVVDTWAFKNNGPDINDIVVFKLKLEKNSPYLIKRVQEKPKYLKEKSSDFIYLVGDNKNSSLDSRIFGAVDAKNILGKVEIIVYSASSNKRKEVTASGIFSFRRPNQYPPNH